MNKQTRYSKSILLISTLFLLFSCSVTKLQQQGSVEPQSFHSQLDFTTIKTVIVLEAKIDGEVKSVLFDTGADLSLIQRDTILGKASDYSGASKRTMELGKEILTSLELGNISFLNTHALNGDLKGLKEQIPNFGGIIGQSIISKANWLIDYPNSRLEISDKELTDESFSSLEIIREHGAPYTYITVDGERHKVIIDFGSSSAINLPSESKLAKELMSTIEFSDNERERYTLGGLQTIMEKVGVVPKVQLGSFQFENVDVNINTSSQPRIGVSFFKDFIIYIDNSNGGYKIKRIRN